jgi:hypothetical protein
MEQGGRSRVGETRRCRSSGFDDSTATAAPEKAVPSNWRERNCVRAKNLSSDFVYAVAAAFIIASNSAATVGRDCTRANQAVRWG